MKKLVLILSILVLLMASLLVACKPPYEYNGPYKDPPPIEIEETYWYLDTGDNGLPWYYLYVKATNTSKKSIKEVKWYCEFQISGYKENGESFKSFGYVLPLEWPLDDNWQAGKRQVMRIPIQCVEDKDKDDIEFMIHTLENGGVMPFWIKYTGFGGSWGDKNSDGIKPPPSTIWIDPEIRPYIKYLVQIPKFTVLGDSE